MIKRILSFILLFLLVGYSCVAQQSAIYTTFLETVVPAQGSEVTFNAPVLRWPYQKGKQVTYSVQLSQDSLFGTGTTKSINGLKGAFYNPHQLLSEGVWYWKYRVSGKEWSPVNRFLVTSKALNMVSPGHDVFLSKVPAGHPRILTDYPDQHLRPLSNRPDAIAILTEADKVLEQKVPTENDAQPAAVGANERQNKKIAQDAVVRLGHTVYKRLTSLCQAYLLTGNKAYSKKAITIAMEVSRWDPKGISGSRDFTDGACMAGMALVFDTFFDQLTTEEKSLLSKAIKVRAAGFYKSWVNSIESKVLSGHVWQLLLNEFFKTALALYGYEPEATEWLSYAYELFLARSPVLGGMDGGWGEGAYYFHMNMETLIEIPDKIKQYTGFDFVGTHPWYRNQANWLIYNFPPGSSADGFGDNTEELFEPPASYASYARVMAGLLNEPRFGWYFKKMQQYHKTDLSKEPVLRWFRLVNIDKLAMPSVPDTLSFPMGYLAGEVGVASLHTDPAHLSNDIMIAMRASPFGAYGHILADQNTFSILVGGKRLFYRTGYKVAMDDPHRLGWSKHTKGGNGVLINGEGQPYYIDSYGYFSRFLQGDQLAYMKGDASHAYQSSEAKVDFGVEKFYRHVVLLKPNLIVMYDELESKQEAEWSWLIHSLEDMKLDSAKQLFTATIGNARGIGKLWSSEPVAMSLTDKFDVPAVRYRNYEGMRTKKYEDNQWHLKAVNRAKTSQIRFLSVFRIVKNGAVELPLKESSDGSGTVKATIGDWEIEAVLSSGLPPQLQIRSLSGKAAFAAYGNELEWNGKQYKGTIPESSKLVEPVNGIGQLKEVGDEPVPFVR